MIAGYNLNLAYSNAFISRISAIVLLLSLSGEAKDPNDPLAKTAPITKGKGAPAACATEIPKGIRIPQVPQDEPIKYEIKAPKINKTGGINIVGIQLTFFVTNCERPKSSVTDDTAQTIESSKITDINLFPDCMNSWIILLSECF